MCGNTLTTLPYPKPCPYVSSAVRRGGFPLRLRSAISFGSHQASQSLCSHVEGFCLLPYSSGQETEKKWAQRWTSINDHIHQKIWRMVKIEGLRVEFLLKTDSGYPKDTGVTLFTPATPGNPLRYNTHWSAPPVSDLAHSRGPRKTQGQSLSQSFRAGFQT